MGLFSSIFNTVGKVASVAAPFIKHPAYSAAASALGTMYSNQQKQEYNDRINQQSIELANTAHQREVADLKAAGLNPILAANAGAQTPGLTVAQIDDPSKTSTAAYSAAKQLQLQQKEMMSRIDLNSASAAKQRADAALSTERINTEQVNQRLTQAMVGKTEEETKKIRIEAEQYYPKLLQKLDQDIRTGKASEAELLARAYLNEVNADVAMKSIQIAMYNAETQRISVNQQGAFIIQQIANLKLENQHRTFDLDWKREHPNGVVMESGSIGALGGHVSVQHTAQFPYR